MKNNIKKVVDEIFDKGRDLTDEEISQQLVSSLQNLSPKNLADKEKEDYYYFLASGYFRLKDYVNANRIWKASVEEFPDNSKMNYGYGQALIYSRNPEDAIEYFDKVISTDLVGDYCLQMAVYMYLWNRPEKGFKYLQPLFEEYIKLRIIDDTFVHLRNLPFFSYTWHTFVALLWIDGRIHEIKNEFSTYRNLSEYNFKYLESIINAIVSDNPNMWKLTLLSEQQDEFKRILFSVRAIDEYDKAKVMLENAPHANHMSNDILKYMALAELSNRFEKREEENRYIDEVFRISDILLEPYHVVTYNFLDYNEKLKEIYRNRLTNKNST